MAFENVKLTQEERQKFLDKKIVDFRRTWPGRIKYVEPLDVTINKEHSICLVSLGKEREEPDFEYFAFITEDFYVNIVLDKKTQFDNTITWSIKKTELVELKDKCSIDKSDLYKMLKDALREFRWNGSSDERINGPANVVFKF